MKRSAAIFFTLLAASACRDEMYDQPRYEPYEPSELFPDGRGSRPLVPGTVAREQPLLEALSIEPLEPMTLARLQRGRERFNIYCSPCHDRAGTGQGVIVRRGFQRPPTFHQPRLREAPDEHIYQVISQGFGAMYPQGSRIAPRDRWAIVAYVRALQLSQNASLAELPADARAALEKLP